MNSKIEDKELWYYFGKCNPKPVKLQKGTRPIFPYLCFSTESDCQKYIDSLRIKTLNLI